MKKNFIRTIIGSTMLAVVTIFASCDEDTGITIDVPQTQEVIYAIDPFSGTVIDKADTVSSNLDSVLAANNATRDDIESIILSNMELSMTDSNGVAITTQNFNNIKSMAISVAELTGNFSGMLSIDSATMLTFHDMNPLNPQSLVIPIDLLPFVSKPSFRVQFVGALNNAVTTKFYVKSRITFMIKAKL